MASSSTTRRIRWLPLAAAGLGAGWLLRGRTRRFDGQTVLITGGSRGLGLLLAREFASRGANLVLCARDYDELVAARRELEQRFGTQVHARRCDIANRDQVEALVQEASVRFGGIDVLVNNAGVIQIGPAAAMSEQDYREALEVILWGTIHCTRAVLPRMRARGAGRILDITSIGGVIPVPHLAPYSTAKFAAVGYSGSVAAEVAADGIQVTTAVPWLMRTGSFLHALAKGQREKEMTWFTLGATLPLISMDAGRAARQMVDACARGQRWITVGVPAKLARLGMALAPGAMIATNGLISRLMPTPAGIPETQAAEPGWKHREGVARSFLTRLGDRAARQNNELPRGYH